MKYYPSKFPKGERPSGKGRFICLDSEAIGLLFALRKGDSTSSHCIVAIDARSQEVFVFFDPYEARDPDNREMLEQEGTQHGYLNDGIKFLMEAESLICQNFSGYDALAFEKVFGKEWHYNYMEKRGKNADREWYYPNKVMDTYVMSCVLNPERKVPPQAYALGRGNVGPHSIEAHGIRIGRYKPDNEDWTKLTDHMIHRCEEDVHIGLDMYHYLMKEWEEQSAKPNPRTKLGIGTAYRCELQTAFAVARQAQRGFRIHTQRALERVEILDNEIITTREGFEPHMPLRLLKKKLTQPVNGITHGSSLEVTKGITKKLTAKAWRAYLEAFCERDADSFLARFGQEAVNMMFSIEEGNKVTQKALQELIPIQQCNDVGEYTAGVTKHYPEVRGFIHDYDSPMVMGDFTPIRYEEIPLGNRDSVKQVLFDYGWLGVTYNKAEQKLIDDGQECDLKPWAGKIDEASIDAWIARDGDAVPEWCKGIARWYILTSRRTQILNPKDVVYFQENGRWPKQQNGKRQCRGLIARTRNDDYCMEAQDYYEQYDKWPTDMTEEWRAPAEAFACATNTFRMRHKVVVNIPSRGLFPLRDLFIAGIGKKILGCDGSGLELRMLAHFLNDAIYQEVVLSGDIHTYNQELAGLPLRDMAKTFIYAFLYGSGVTNLAKVCGMSTAKMSGNIERFKRELPALAKLIERIQASGEKAGYLLAADGRWGRIRSSNGKMLVHTMLNVLLQMTGSISMKYGLCFAERVMISEGVGLDEDGYVAWVANVHDEVQMEVPEDEVEYVEYRIEKDKWKVEEKAEYFKEGKMFSAPTKIGVCEGDGTVIIQRSYHRAGQIINEAFVKGGEFLKLRCPLAGEYKIGDSWHDTH